MTAPQPLPPSAKELAHLIREYEPVGVRFLAQKIGMPNPKVSVAIRQMERAGLVRRYDDGGCRAKYVLGSEAED